MSQLFFCLSLIMMLSANAQSAAITFQSATKQTALLELYTSEGCSSCPPAETWLSRLKESPDLWKEFVPLAFHVDYWDYLGWRDPWAAREFSDRQRAYAAHWRSENIYTPGFVLNGQEWRDWSGRKDAPKFSGAKAGVLTVSSSDTNHWRVSFAPTLPGGANYEIQAALLAGGLNSDVRAGENRGRRLNHDFVVVAILKASVIRRGEIAQGVFTLPVRRTTPESSLALAVWVTHVGRLEPLQATGGWLVQPAPGR